jgi:hypothetical protein
MSSPPKPPDLPSQVAVGVYAELCDAIVCVLPNDSRMKVSQEIYVALRELYKAATNHEA